jgi:hypothetical protein
MLQEWRISQLTDTAEEILVERMNELRNFEAGTHGHPGKSLCLLGKLAERPVRQTPGRSSPTSRKARTRVGRPWPGAG